MGMETEKKYNRVITYGTFDMFHQGHYNILKRAKALAQHLIVGVTSESFDIERGKLGVRDSLDIRISNVRKTGFADEIIIEEFQGQKIRDVHQYNADALVVGSDWVGKFDYLKSYCDVIYLERTRNISSTELRLKEQTLNIGVVVDSADDNNFVEESKYVSGIHVESVFCEEETISEELCLRKEIHRAYSKIEPFLDSVDVVYIDVNSERKYEYIRSAFDAGKHVISRSLIGIKQEQIEELIKTAREKKLILLDGMRLAYLRAFNQLTWMVECGSIGKVIGMNCSISNNEDDDMDSSTAFLYLLYALNCICGPSLVDFNSYSNDCGEDKHYIGLLAKCEKGTAFLELGNHIPLDCGLTVYGEHGKIVVSDDWWNTGYFEVYYFETQNKKRFCYNYEGNGMRYILRELLIMLRENSKEPLRFTYDETITLYSSYNKIMEENPI